MLLKFDLIKAHLGHLDPLWAQTGSFYLGFSDLF